MSERKVGDVWKVIGERTVKSIDWKVQMPKGIMTFRKKSDATSVANSLKRTGQYREEVE